MPGNRVKKISFASLFDLLEVLLEGALVLPQVPETLSDVGLLDLGFMLWLCLLNDLMQLLRNVLCLLLNIGIPRKSLELGNLVRKAWYMMICAGFMLRSTMVRFASVSYRGCPLELNCCNLLVLMDRGQIKIM